ncbi:MAG: T9SS type A sorting domain-containing protein [Candidatus Azobacteroides sp.]|nr:T9SS type A sorting domain-containing protein [Candidatus Azobacteroides sp.]
MKKLLLIIFLTFATGGFSFSQEGNLKLPGDADQPAISLADSNRLLVQNVKAGDLLQVYSIVGVKVVEAKMDSSSKEFILNVPKGYYIVKVSNMVRKIAVK